ncbi:hypothetical protein ACO0LC_22205 [Undibacterium sp. JH2W]|uniref:hypothetical protein n=1 Tax=Undibacterium sp. JH2W TaxID=3413037 RepID=UPI003BEF7F8E
MERKWSKIKKTFEERIAIELKSMISIHVTAYASGGRGWIQFKGEEIVTTEAPGFLYSIFGHRIYNNFMDGQTIELGRACGELLNISPISARISPNPYIRGLFALEKRCGRRTLETMREIEHDPFPILLMSLMAHSFGLTVKPYFHDACGRQILPEAWLTPLSA